MQTPEDCAAAQCPCLTMYRIFHITHRHSEPMSCHPSRLLHFPSPHLKLAYARELMYPLQIFTQATPNMISAPKSTIAYRPVFMCTGNRPSKDTEVTQDNPSFALMSHLGSPPPTLRSCLTRTAFLHPLSLSFLQWNNPRKSSVSFLVSLPSDTYFFTQIPFPFNAGEFACYSHYK